MGLDITAYSNITKIIDIEKIENDDWEIHVTRWYPDMERSLDVKEGYYESNGESYGFRAGSYSGYNKFRKLLCECVLNVPDTTVWENNNEYKDKPMFEIINFSDCEGTFGPTVSKKLHKDFVDNKENFENFIKNSSYPDFYITIYDHFTKGFEISSNENGLLHFH